MINMGLSVVERQTFEALLATHHSIEIELCLTDLDHNELASIGAKLMDGQVTVDADAGVTRALELDLLDPTGELHLDSGSPNDGALFVDRMLQVRYCVINPEKTKRYVCPIFVGPISSLERNDASLKVEALGKEVFGLGEAWNELTFKKGTRVTTAIKRILTDVMGESNLAIPDRDKKLPRNVSVGGDKYPWVVAKQLADSIGFQLYYDGIGVCRMRRTPDAAVFTFREGVGGTVKTKPVGGFDASQIVNAVEVLGKKPQKKRGQTAKKRPHARRIAPRSHPLSPWSIGRSGGPRFLPRRIEDDGITTDAQARERARLELKRGLLQSVEVSYDALVVPHLEELDVVKLSTDTFSATHRLRKFAIPLSASGGFTVGYVRNVKLQSGVIRGRRR